MMKERLEYLFWQYLHSTASEKELEEFLSYVKEAKYDQPLRDQIREVYNDIRASDPLIASYIDKSGSLVLKAPDPALPGSYPAPRRRSRRPAIALTSILVVSAMAGIIWLKSSVLAGKRQELASVQSLTKKFTERSEQRYLLLSDSTQVWLNANSSLESPDQFNDKKREVYLSGEAYFDVKHADEIPFIIHTGKITTTVLGTAFNIKAYPYLRNVMVSVIRGKVRVSRDNDVVAILQKGQQVKVSKEDSMVNEKNIDTEKIVFWQQGYVSYDDETIEEIVQDLEHLYNVSIDVADHSVLDLKITTSFKRSIGIDEELKLICKLIDKRLVVNRNGQYVIE